MRAVTCHLATGNAGVLKFRRVLPSPHGKVVAPVLPGPDAALVVDVTVEMNDIVDFDGAGKCSGVFQVFPVHGERLRQEKGPLVLPVQLEVEYFIVRHLVTLAVLGKFGNF